MPTEAKLGVIVKFNQDLREAGASAEGRVQWVAATGKRTVQGFFLLEPSVQVFERKTKEPVVHKMDPISSATSVPTEGQG